MDADQVIHNYNWDPKNKNKKIKHYEMWVITDQDKDNLEEWFCGFTWLNYEAMTLSTDRLDTN